MSFYSLAGWAGLNRIRCDVVHVYHTQGKHVISSQGEGRGYRERVGRRMQVRRRQERKDRSTMKRSPEGRQNSLKIGVACLYIHCITWRAMRPVFLCPLLTHTGTPELWKKKREPGISNSTANGENAGKDTGKQVTKGYKDKAKRKSTLAFTLQKTKLPLLSFKAFPVSMSLMNPINGTNCYFPWDMVAITSQCIYFTQATFRPIVHISEAGRSS